MCGKRSAAPLSLLAQTNNPHHGRVTQTAHYSPLTASQIYVYRLSYLPAFSYAEPLSSYQISPMSISTPLSGRLGFGNVTTETLILGMKINPDLSGPSNLFFSIPAANSPQIFFPSSPFLYFLHNGLTTYILLAEECNAHALNRKLFRLTSPKGRQVRQPIVTVLYLLLIGPSYATVDSSRNRYPSLATYNGIYRFFRYYICPPPR